MWESQLTVQSAHFWYGALQFNYIAVASFQIQQACVCHSWCTPWVVVLLTWRGPIRTNNRLLFLSNYQSQADIWVWRPILGLVVMTHDQSQTSDSVRCTNQWRQSITELWFLGSSNHEVMIYGIHQSQSPDLYYRVWETFVVVFRGRYNVVETCSISTYRFSIGSYCSIYQLSLLLFNYSLWKIRLVFHPYIIKFNFEHRLMTWNIFHSLVKL